MTEDAEFTAWCAVNGVKVGYCKEAVFYDEQLTTLRASWNQRLRWVKGYMQMLSYYGGRLLRGIFKRAACRVWICCWPTCPPSSARRCPAWLA